LALLQFVFDHGLNLVWFAATRSGSDQWKRNGMMTELSGQFDGIGHGIANRSLGRTPPHADARHVDDGLMR